MATLISAVLPGIRFIRKGEECHEHLSLLSGREYGRDIRYYMHSAENKKYYKVVEEFDNYFKVRKNVIYERVRFNKRNQLHNESVEQFITEVHRLGDTCEFGKMKEELIRDHLVVGIHDHSLSLSGYRWNQTYHWIRLKA